MPIFIVWEYNQYGRFINQIFLNEDSANTYAKPLGYVVEKYEAIE